MTFFWNDDPVKQAAYEEAERRLTQQLAVKTARPLKNDKLKNCVEATLREVQKARKLINSGIPIEELTQILDVSRQALLVIDSTAMSLYLEQSYDVHRDEAAPGLITHEDYGKYCLCLTKYEKLSSRLSKINTEESKRLMGFIAIVVGLILIVACLVLAGFTGGIASPFSAIGIVLGVSIIVAGVSGIAAVSYGIKERIESGVALHGAKDQLEAIRERASDSLFRIDFEQVRLDFEKALLTDKYLETSKHALGKLEEGDFARIFDDIQMSDFSNQRAFDRLNDASEQGRIGPHLQEVAKHMSETFLDAKHNLLPDIKRSLGLTGCTKEKEQEVVNCLLRASVTLYGEISTAHNEILAKSSTNSHKVNFDYNCKINTVLNVYKDSILTVDAIFNSRPFNTEVQHPR